MKIGVLILILVMSPAILVFSQEPVKKKISLLEFEQTLSPDMVRDTILKRYGPPDNETGSGLCILIYILADSTSLAIGCHGNGIVYAKHTDIDGNIFDLISKKIIKTSDKKKLKKEPKHNKRYISYACHTFCRSSIK